MTLALCTSTLHTATIRFLAGRLREAAGGIGQCAGVAAYTMGFETAIGVETACVHLAISPHIKLSRFGSSQFPDDASLSGLLAGKQETLLLLLFELLYSQVFEANLITPE